MPHFLTFWDNVFSSESAFSSERRNDCNTSVKCEFNVLRFQKIWRVKYFSFLLIHHQDTVLFFFPIMLCYQHILVYHSTFSLVRKNKKGLRLILTEMNYVSLKKYNKTVRYFRELLKAELDKELQCDVCHNRSGKEDIKNPPSFASGCTSLVWGGRTS